MNKDWAVRSLILLHSSRKAMRGSTQVARAAIGVCTLLAEREFERGARTVIRHDPQLSLVILDDGPANR